MAILLRQFSTMQIHSKLLEPCKRRNSITFNWMVRCCISIPWPTKMKEYRFFFSTKGFIVRVKQSFNLYFLCFFLFLSWILWVDVFSIFSFPSSFFFFATKSNIPPKCILISRLLLFSLVLGFCCCCCWIELMMTWPVRRFAEGKSDKEILDHLLKNFRYDKRLLPPVDGKFELSVWKKKILKYQYLNQMKIFVFEYMWVLRV